MKNKKVVVIAGILILAVAGAAYGSWFYLQNGSKDSKDRVYVEKVSSVMGMVTGNDNRYSGVVEPQKTVNINADSDRTVAEVSVKEGDTVDVGTPLFSYETDDLKMDLDKAQLDIDNTNNEIENYKQQISELEKERDAAAEGDKFQYITQIQTLQTNIKQSEYEKQSKLLEIDKTKKKIANSQVVSTIAGVVKTINSTDGTTPNTDGGSNAFISILSTGAYRIRGQINEQNMSSIQPGASVIVRSRMDETITWKGTIDTVDTEKPQSDTEDGSGAVSNGSDGNSSTSLNQSSNYPFYVTLENTDGLMMGQHVLIELDQGQTVQKTGIWLYSSYIIKDKDSAYVWADNGKSRLEKRTVKLGDYDESLDEYEIKSGLKETDLIAFPMNGFYEGVKTVTSEQDVDYSSDLYSNQGTESVNEGISGTEMPGTDIMGTESMGTDQQMVTPKAVPEGDESITSTEVAK